MPTQRSVVTIGLPESGKTTFLAALWHLIHEANIETRLRLEKLQSGELRHLNAIADLWRSGRNQNRTTMSDMRFVELNLSNQGGEQLRLSFPDVAGEAYRQIWEDRECDPEIAEMLCAGGILLFIHADTIKPPVWVADNATALGLEGADGAAEVQEWHPGLAPTQVKMVGLLSLLRQHPLDTGPRRIAVMLSAWDKARVEDLSPAAFLAAKLPLLHQYLRQSRDGWEWRVYGVSAQGGEYDPPLATSHSAETASLLELTSPSERIQLVYDGNPSHDLTEPLEWLMG